MKQTRKSRPVNKVTIIYHWSTKANLDIILMMGSGSHLINQIESLLKYLSYLRICLYADRITSEKIVLTTLVI